MATGFEQARSVVAALAGDLVAADDVQLELPETGVCSTDFQVDAEGRVVDCCGGPAAGPAAACCAADEDIKAQGGEGCGCPTTKPATKRLSAIKVVTAGAPSCCAADA
jgi:hypothetical protein